MVGADFRKNVMIAGAASGLAAAFNTPLGGIIFAIEELAKTHIKYIKSPLFVAVYDVLKEKYIEKALNQENIEKK